MQCYPEVEWGHFPQILQSSGLNLAILKQPDTHPLCASLHSCTTSIFSWLVRQPQAESLAVLGSVQMHELEGFSTAWATRHRQNNHSLLVDSRSSQKRKEGVGMWPFQHLRWQHSLRPLEKSQLPQNRQSCEDNRKRDWKMPRLSNSQQFECLEKRGKETAGS